MLIPLTLNLSEPQGTLLHKHGSSMYITLTEENFSNDSNASGYLSLSTAILIAHDEERCSCLPSNWI